MRVVVDSMKGDSSTPIPPAVLDSVKGAVYRAYISKEGRPGKLEATSGTSAASQVQGLLSDFFPWVRAGIRPGQSWADTSVTTTGEGADTVTVRRVTNYRAVPPEPKQPAKSIRVATEYSSQVAGSQPTPSGSARIEGNGSGKGSYLVSPEGHYLGGEWEAVLGTAAVGVLCAAAVADQSPADHQGQRDQVNELRGRPRPLALVTGSLLLAACASGSGVRTTETPEPEPGAPSSGTPAPSAGHGPAITYGPLRAAGFRLERHDSLTFEFEGGATQQQARDRVAFLRVSLAQASAPGEQLLTVVLDSLQAVENGVPVAPDSLLAVRGTQWTATLAPGTGLSPFKANRASTLGDEVQGRLPLLFPTLPAGGVREGMAWTDTTRYEVVADAFPGTEEAVVTYQASTGEANSRQGDRAREQRHLHPLRDADAGRPGDADEGLRQPEGRPSDRDGRRSDRGRRQRRRRDDDLGAGGGSDRPREAVRYLHHYVHSVFLPLNHSS